MKQIFIFFFIVAYCSVLSQDLHIFYKVHKDSMWYEKKGRAVNTLYVRKGKKIVVHMVEYNNYIYQSKIESANYATTPPGFASESSNFLGMIPGLINSLIPGGSAVAPLLNTPLFGNILGILSPSDSSAQARGSSEELSEYKEKLEELEQSRIELNGMLTEYNRLSRSRFLLTSDQGFIDRLLTNPKVTPSVIKSVLNGYFADALLLNEGSEFTINDVQKLNQRLLGTDAVRAMISDKSRQFETRLNDFKKLHKRLKGAEHGIDALYPMFKEYEKQEPVIVQLAKDIETSLAAEPAGKSGNYLDEIQKMFLRYVELKDNNFTLIHMVDATSRFVVLDIMVYKRDSASHESMVGNEDALQKHLSLKVNTFGGFTLETTVGVQGAGLQAPVQDYFVLNNTIYAEDKDKFIPFVGSMFNVGYQVSSGFMPALSMGIGVPLTNKENISSLSYLIGPSLLLGKGQALALTAGIVISKVNRLSRNLHVGDELILGNGVLPTVGRFEKGVFVGVSYNINTR